MVPKENENNAYAKFGGDRQRVLWYFPRWPIGSKQKLSPMTVSPTPAIDDFPVTQVSTAKSLQVTIDDNLKWG